MAVDNSFDNSMKLVNLSNGVSNEDWTNMIEKMFNQEDELEIGPEEVVDLNENVTINPKAKLLRVFKSGYKTFKSEQNNNCDKRI